MREVEMKRNGQPRVRVLIVTLLLILISQLPVFADGLIIIREPVPTLSPFPLEVRYHHVDVKINGNIASTYIDQEFYNPTNMNLEGYYIFPIPKGAVINEFSMERYCQTNERSSFAGIY
jgi:hypothetical protein